MRHFFVLLLGILATANSSACSLRVQADEPTREGIWLLQRENDFGIQVRTAELILTPKAESRPALKHRFLPDGFDLQDGNAAIFYLRAMGFLEQESARNQLSDFRKKARKEAESKGEDPSNAAPNCWLDMPPKDLPLDEVKQYLSFLSFQPRDLAEATRRRSFSLDRNIRQVASPVNVLLPEIQYMRELARNQKLRCAVAIAEGRVDDAIAILGQQYALANHLGSDEFLVSNLVGAAVAGIAFEDALYLLEKPGTPNLYWAFASLPNPIINMQSSLAFERQLLFEEVKALKEVDDTPRNVGYWQDFIERILPQFQSLLLLDPQPTVQDRDSMRTLLIATIGASYPGATRYLIEEVGLDRGQVENYCTAQTYFLAMKRYCEQSRDEHFKWTAIPFADAMANSQFNELDKRTAADCARIGWSSGPATTFLPAIGAVRNAQQRIQQSIAMLQTIEAIRIFGAANGGKLPSSLDRLSFPAPMDPATGKPFLYEASGDKAVLTGHRFPGLQTRIILRFTSPIK
jgi:hypothetical protein